LMVWSSQVKILVHPMLLLKHCLKRLTNRIM
jgi:hypothetical protein